MTLPSTTPVLICGAGPTGLLLALCLTKDKIPVRIIDKLAQSGTTSRAIVMHARTLEFYHQLGLDTEVIAQGQKFDSGVLWVKGEQRAHINIGDMGVDISPYPFVLNYPQDRHEAFLEQHLHLLGVSVERNVALESFKEDQELITATLRHQDGATETLTVNYIAGCDGAHSVVRTQLGIEFPGGTYEELFYVADLTIDGPVANGEINLCLDKTDFLAVFPMKGKNNVRVVGTVLPGAEKKDDVTWSDVSDSILKQLKIEVINVNWFSHYRVHKRVASNFRRGNAFLLGDAGHIHSPVGGQGMNTGLGDAFNLAWKLAGVIRKNYPVSILDTYEPERIEFARTLVKTTDEGFTFVNKKILAGNVRPHPRSARHHARCLPVGHRQENHV